MVLGRGLIDSDGVRHKMAGLLPHSTSMVEKKRHLGYRQLQHNSPLPFGPSLRGHEFHYSSQIEGKGVAPLFSAQDALGTVLPEMGMVVGSVMGSYAHIVDGVGL